MRLVILIFFALVCGPALASDLNDNMQRNCAARWVDNFRMQSACFNAHERGWLHFNKLTQDHIDSAALRKAFAKCLRDWPGKIVGVNWRMADACAVDQVNNYFGARQKQ